MITSVERGSESDNNCRLLLFFRGNKAWHFMRIVCWIVTCNVKSCFLWKHQTIIIDASKCRLLQLWYTLRFNIGSGSILYNNCVTSMRKMFLFQISWWIYIGFNICFDLKTTKRQRRIKTRDSQPNPAISRDSLKTVEILNILCAHKMFHHPY